RPANRQGDVRARRSVRAEPATGGVVVRDGGGTPGVGRGPGPVPAETEGTACSGVLEQRGSGAGRAGTCSWPGPPSGPGREMSPAVTSTLGFWLLRATRNTVPQNGLRRRGRPGTTLGNDRLGRPSRLPGSPIRPGEPCRRGRRRPFRSGLSVVSGQAGGRH